MARFAVLVCCLALSCGDDNTPSGSGNRRVRRILVKARQGVAVDEKHFYAISDTTILKCDKETGTTVASWRPNSDDRKRARFKHLNSGTVIDGKLYCAHSRFPVDRNVNSVEVWDVQRSRLTHETSIPMPRKHGSLTWIDRSSDGSWWACYATYGKGRNESTKLIQYRFADKRFAEIKAYVFPPEVIRHWGAYSCSGGSWGPDGFLYTTAHGGARCYVLKPGESNTLVHVRTETGVGFRGQGIAWDRWADPPVLWGIIRGESLSLTRIARSLPGAPTPITLNK